MIANTLEERAHNAFRIILTQDSSKGHMAYAQAYAEAGLSMEGDSLRVQILYVLNNLQYWRGEVARRTKKELREVEKKLARKFKL